MYDSSLKRKWDNENVLNYALQEGLEKGLEKGLERGLEKGLEKGRKEGEHKKALDIAHELKKEGLTREFIAKTTGLSIDEIEAL
jgi:predicted transposase/invertase (TIGR01784 family)